MVINRASHLCDPGSILASGRMWAEFSRSQPDSEGFSPGTPVLKRSREDEMSKTCNVTLSAQYIFQFGQGITPLFTTPCQLHESAAPLLLQHQPMNGRPCLQF